MEIATIPNFLSFSRIPLAFVFLVSDPTYRAIAIILAMITDGLDGFLARRYRMESTFGLFLDPFADKFFALFALTVLFQEGSLSFFQAGALLSRDVALFLFGLYLTCSQKLHLYNFHAIICGKASTFLQFLVFFGLATGFYAVPFYVYYTFIALGVLALFELSSPKMFDWN